MNRELRRKLGYLLPQLLIFIYAILLSGCVAKTEHLRMKRALGMEIIELRQRKLKSRKELDNLRNEVTQLQTKLGDASKKYKKQKSHYEALNLKLKGKIKLINDEKKRLGKDLSKAQAMLKGRGKKLFELQAELTKKQAEFAKKQQEFDQTSKALTEKLKTQQAALAKKQKELKVTLAKAQRLEKQVKKLKATFDDLTNRLKSLVQAGKLKIQMNHGLLTLQLPEKILFSSGSSRVKREGKRAIADVTDILKTMKYRWQVVGHTDSVGRERSNWRLSSRRALAVLFVMLKKGMPASQVSFAGFGQFQPKAPNDTKENKALNRRTELILIPDLSELFKMKK